ncbi:phage terminase small subunit [Erwinia psidii]|uniref:Terminase n=1 Tax=Erwinia psidii TaxID=69224 RepID=A0A3N6SCK8_9GAMM|nr:phage terminase small subunit [Erwinia psidii]RQM39130.1 terminase [Erwinia psidii]
MALTPCQRHRARIRAEQAINNRTPVADSPVSLHVQLRELEADIARLRALEVTADRVELKRDVLLPKWQPVAEQYLAGDRVFANPVFVYCIIWLFDTGSYDQALDWADTAISQGQSTPENFKSNMAAFVADTVLAWSENQAALGHSIEPYFSRTFENIRTKWRLHEEINAKWFKFAGLNLLRDENGEPRPTAVEDVTVLEQADALLAQAHAFNNQVGVKTARERIAARIRSLTAA